MAIKTCTLEICNKKHKSRGYCERHYRNFLKYGDPEAVPFRVSREKGYREKTSNGYIRVYGYTDHPKNDKGRVYEHVLVMEEQLGRYLLPGENVHHKNGDRTNNAPENLELWVVSQPSGQRPEDLVAWAKEILARYDPQNPSLP